MLLRQDLSRSHNCALIAIEGSHKESCGGDCGFAGADIALQQAAHRSAAAEIAEDLAEHAALSRREAEWKGCLERTLICQRGPECCTGHSLGALRSLGISFVLSSSSSSLHRLAFGGGRFDEDARQIDFESL